MFGLTPYNRKQAMVGRNDGWGFGRLLDDFFTDVPFSAWMPAGSPMRADIREMEKEYVIEAEIPGANKEDIKLDLRDDVLTISVEHTEQVEEEKEQYIRRERKFGSYSRSFQVENVKNEDVTAKYENGILKISLPKDEPGKENRHQIKIQ